MVKKLRCQTDFLVIGSGIAGLISALNASSLGKVIVISKTKPDDCNTSLAQGGIAAVLPGSDDSISLHIEDTLRVGAGLANPRIVEKVISYAPNVIAKLKRLGVNFTVKEGPDDGFDLTREGGHSRNRILHVADYTGRAIEEVLLEKVRKNPRITLLENHMAIDLLTQHHIPNYSMKPWEKIECYGAYVYDTKNEIVHTILARKTILASGGAGRLYQYTTNSQIATGDGIAMAYRAGAKVANLEFVQFHPTVLYEPSEDDNPAFLISESVRGEGGILVNSRGERFMKKYHPMGELAPRDIVARAIDHELKETGDKYVFIDIRHLDPNFIKKRFPNIYENCLKRGIDITKDLIPVVPAAHYLCGGVVVDEYGRTDIDNLYACGEVAHTGLHGANRLASNSLLEACAFADFCFDDIKKHGLGSKEFPTLPDWDDSGIFDSKEWVIIRHNFRVLRALMWDYMGIVRKVSRLEKALKRIRLIWQEVDDFYRTNPVRRKMLELRNMTYVAELMIRSALMRHESRGLHYLIDYPQPDSRFAHDTVLHYNSIYRETHIP